MPDALDDRLRAVERALDDSPDRAASATTTATSDDDDRRTDNCRRTDDTADARRPRTHAGDPGRIDDVASRLDDVEETVAELEAAVQALRGYAGKVRAVDERVEERADAALAAVEDVEERLDALESDSADGPPRHGRGATPDGSRRERGDRRDQRGPTDRRATDADPSLDAEWPTSPAPRFDREDDPDPGLLARLRDLL